MQPSEYAGGATSTSNAEGAGGVGRLPGLQVHSLAGHVLPPGGRQHAA